MSVRLMDESTVEKMVESLDNEKGNCLAGRSDYWMDYEMESKMDNSMELLLVVLMVALLV
jgi:hypothetical protein